MAAQFAKDTEVSVERSRAEIEALLMRYGASAFGTAWEGRRTAINFKVDNRFIRMILTLPDPTERRFTHQKVNQNSGWTPRAETSRAKVYEQACRSLWRSLALVVKAKLEAVAAGISTVENEFMAFVVLPNNQTMAEYYGPQLEECYTSGQMPSPIAGLLPAPREDFET